MVQDEILSLSVSLTAHFISQIKSKKLSLSQRFDAPAGSCPNPSSFFLLSIESLPNIFCHVRNWEF